MRLGKPLQTKRLLYQRSLDKLKRCQKIQNSYLLLSLSKNVGLVCGQLILQGVLPLVMGLGQKF